jgi:hypothetical protein
LTVLADWLDRHTSRAPAALRTRVLEYALAAESEAALPEVLASAARTALGRVLAHSGDRSVALDLLAADALITLALLAQSQLEPERLSHFAAAVLQPERPPA